MKNSSLRICFVTEDFYPEFIGGQGIYGYNLVTHLANMGNDITVIAEHKPKRRGFWHGAINVKIHFVPFCFGLQLILAFLEYVLFWLKLRNIQFDILHTNQLSGLLFILFRPKNVKKIIVSVHNTNYDMRRITTSDLKRLLYLPLMYLEKIVYQQADALLFNSPDEQKALAAYYDVDGKPTKVIYLGSPRVHFSANKRLNARTKIRQTLNLKQNTPVVLYVGRLVPRKKVDTLLEALQILYTTHVPVWAIIIGIGPDANRLKSLAPPNVSFLGFVDDTNPYFLGSDLFVTTSVAEGGFSLAVLEAANHGLPLILSNSASGFPILKEGVNGFIVNPNDEKKIANRILQILKYSHGMGKKSIQFARAFTWQRCALQTLSFYRSLL